MPILPFPKSFFWTGQTNKTKTSCWTWFFSMILLFTIIFMSKLLFFRLKILPMLFSEVKLVWTKCIHWVCPYLFLGLALSSWKSVNFFLMWKALSRPVSKQDTNKTEKAFCLILSQITLRSNVFHHHFYSPKGSCRAFIRQ